MAAAAALLSLAVACRSPTAGHRTAPASAPPVVEASASVAAALPVDGSPRVVVMPSGDAYLVLRAGPEQLADGVAWDVLYLAGGDAAVLARPDADAALSSAARDLLDAFRTLAELAHLRRVSVTALFGKAGGRGAVAQLWFTREDGGWRADERSRRGAVADVPELPAGVVRDRQEEASARDAAAAFVSDVNGADYDAAWARTSVVVKVTTSRTEFERRVASLRDAEPVRAAGLYLAFPTPMERLLPGTYIEAWFARDTADGPSVEALALRLEDDMEWRVASVVKLVAARARGGPDRREDGGRPGTWAAP